MSLRPIALLSSALATGAAAVLLAPTGVAAGQYKTLSAETLAPGAQVQATSSPKNSGIAMELDVYEFKAVAGGAQYRCRITTNGTGQPLGLKFIRVDGTVIGSCVAPPGGGCNTVYSVPEIGGGNKPLCLVHTGLNLLVVGRNPTYTMAVQRHP
jgi:hypothetical protein